MGKPLALYSLSAIDLFLKQNPDINYDIVVNTDSRQLIEIFQINSLRQVNVVKRKMTLAGDSVTKLLVIADTLHEMEKEGKEYDIVMDLDITSPLRRAEDIKKVFQLKKDNNMYDVVFSAVESRRNPYFNMVKQNRDGFYEKVIKSDFSARQQAPKLFDMNASIYAYSPNFLRKKNSNIFDGNCGIVKMIDTGILDLDHENDFFLMEIIADYFFHNVDGFIEVYENIKDRV